MLVQFVGLGQAAHRHRAAFPGGLLHLVLATDDERTAELREYLLEPVRALKLRARVYGVRYAEDAQRSLAQAGIDYAGWLPNYQAPEVFARYAVTLHVPRRPMYALSARILWLQA